WTRSARKTSAATWNPHSNAPASSLASKVPPMPKTPITLLHESGDRGRGLGVRGQGSGIRDLGAEVWNSGRGILAPGGTGCAGFTMGGAAPSGVGLGELRLEWQGTEWNWVPDLGTARYPRLLRVDG